MGISVEEIRKKVAERKGHDALDVAIYHQNRIKFHAQKLIQQSVYYQPTADFFAFVQNILPHDKYKLFVELFRYPVDTNEICEVCFDKLSRIFDGRNPSYNYQFLTSMTGTTGSGTDRTGCMNRRYGRQRAGNTSRRR